MVPRGGSARADEVVDPAGLIGSWHNNAGLGQSTLRSPPVATAERPFTCPSGARTTL
jgi:hypothetical protein